MHIFQFVSMIYYSKILSYFVHAKSHEASSVHRYLLLTHQTIPDVMRKWSVSETPFHAWVTKYYIHTEGSFTTGDLVRLPVVIITV